MTPSDLLECLRRDGFSIEAVPTRGSKLAHLLIDPIAKLSTERVAQIKANREALIALLLSKNDEDREWEAKADALVLEAWLCDPFAEPPDVALVLSEGGAPVDVKLRESILVKVSQGDEPPEYVALDPDYWRDLCQWAAEAKEANQKKPPKPPRKVRK